MTDDMNTTDLTTLSLQDLLDPYMPARPGRKGGNQRAFARRLGLTAQSVNAYFRAGYVPHDRIRSVADELRVSVAVRAELYRRAGQPEVAEMVILHGGRPIAGDEAAAGAA